MLKNSPLILLLIIMATACSQGVSRIVTRSLPNPNPTNYVFTLPPEELRQKALEAFSIDRQMNNPIFGRSHSSVPHGEMGILFPEFSTNAFFAEAIFRDPANVNDVYL